MAVLNQELKEKAYDIIEGLFENNGSELLSFYGYDRASVDDAVVLETLLDEGFPDDIEDDEVEVSIVAYSKIPIDDWVDLLDERIKTTDEYETMAELEQVISEVGMFNFVKDEPDNIETEVLVHTDIDDFSNENPLRCIEHTTCRLEEEFDSEEIRVMVINDPSLYEELVREAEEEGLDSEGDIDIENINVTMDFESLSVELLSDVTDLNNYLVNDYHANLLDNGYIEYDLVADELDDF